MRPVVVGIVLPLPQFVVEAVNVLADAAWNFASGFGISPLRQSSSNWREPTGAETRVPRGPQLRPDSSNLIYDLTRGIRIGVVSNAGCQAGPADVVRSLQDSSVLGQGGGGEVYRAWDPRLEREVAVKILHERFEADPERVTSFIAEARAASALNHPNIVTVFDAAVEGDTSFIVSELIDGRPLRDELSRGPIPLKRLLDLATQIADGSLRRARSGHRARRSEARKHHDHAHRPREDRRLRPDARGGFAPRRRGPTQPEPADADGTGPPGRDDPT